MTCREFMTYREWSLRAICVPCGSTFLRCDYSDIDYNGLKVGADAQSSSLFLMISPGDHACSSGATSTTLFLMLRRSNLYHTDS